MTILGLLSSVASGGLLGLLGQGLVGWLEIYRADKESARKIAEMRALAEIKVEEAAWAAFAASQKASEAPANVPPWCAAIITLFRPFLTLLFFGLAAYAFATSGPAARESMLSEVNACAFGLAYWWFGSRYQKRISSKN